MFTIPILAFTMSDLGVHVAPIQVFTFDRSRRSRSAGTRTQERQRLLRLVDMGFALASLILLSPVILVVGAKIG